VIDFIRQGKIKRNNCGMNHASITMKQKHNNEEHTQIITSKGKKTSEVQLLYFGKTKNKIGTTK